MLTRMINGLEEAIISILLAAMTLLVFVEVVLRFGFGTGIMWAQEATLHISAWMVLFGASYGIKIGSHIGVDALVKILPSWLRRFVSAIAVCGCLVYTGLFTYGGWIYLKKMHLIGIELEDMPIPKWIAHSIIVIGMVLMAIRLLILLWNILTGKAEGFKMVDEAQESMHLAEEAQKLAEKGGDSA
ncbi:MAG: TRAP transporter small permease [Deltaproteobacteria bacterium]|nr:MAG: TRAP transporter small permease [Deltaproteobacteria bacterium]